ncbi:MAG: cupredoxin domain-containing protein [Kofleriaceae bacterium]
MAGRLTLDLASIASTADARHDAAEILVGGRPAFVVHDQTIRNNESRLAAELGLVDGLAVGLVLPWRVFNTSIRYLDMSGTAVEIENPFVHHKNQTLTGIGDPWLFARGARTLGGFVLGARVGMTVPLGRTEENPFALGDMGIAHEHSQFGTGTFGAVAGIEASRNVGGVRVDAALLTIQSFYENRHGFQAGDRYAGLAGAASSFGTTQWRFRATTEAIHETAETWSGVLHTDDGNIGRTDVIVGLEATWRFTERWHVGVQAKLPVYTHVVGGQLEPLGFIGVSIGTTLQAFGSTPVAEDEHDHGDDHDHGDHDHGDDHGDHAHDDARADWTGLDKVAVVTDGRVVPLVPVLGKITVFDFWAAWCEPCKDLDRELARIARAHPDDLAVRAYDVVDVDSPANRTYLGTATLPHVKVYGRDGALLWEKSASPSELARAVEATLAASKGTAVAPTKRIAIEANDDGYVPARIEIERGTATTLVFKRTTKHTCATEVVFTMPDGTRVEKELPLDIEVEIPLRIEKPGEIRYSCGMDMFRGTIVVR